MTILSKICPWARASLFIGIGALISETVFFCAVCLGFTRQAVGFLGTVYSFLGMGVVAGVGLSFAILSLLKRESKAPFAVTGLALNLGLAVIGSCFLILLPKS